MKKTVTLLAVGAIAVAAASAHAASATINIEAVGAVQVCDATGPNKPILGGTGASTSGAPITVSTSFVKVAFSITCSNNTHAYVNNYAATSIAVASGSSKGNQAFRGGASSGGVVLSAGCAATGCAASDATTALALAVTNAS